MSAQQLAQILQRAQPMEKRLQKLPSHINLRTATVSGYDQPPLIVPGVASTIAGTSSPPSLAPPPPVPGKTMAPSVGLPGTQSSPSGIAPQNYGSGNQNTIYHYTDLSVDPAATDVSPSGRAIGYFLFTFDNTNYFYCSATMISKSIAVAAGHCVYPGGGSNSSGFIKQGFFFPTCWNCNTGTPYFPYGYATATYVVTTGGWFATGNLDAGYDISAIVLTNRNGTSTEMGNYTGTYGFCTSNCLQSNWYLAARGYPKNYTGGNWMSESQHHAQSDGFDFIFGTGMEGGSSGGPFATNMSSFPPNDASTNLGQFTLRNIIFATRSWGYNDTSIKIGGASSLSGPSNSNNWTGGGSGSVYNIACAQAQAQHGAGSCSPI